MEEKESIGISFGVMNSTIKEQLKEQGFILDNDSNNRPNTREKYMEDMRKYYNSLRISGFLTSSEADKVAMRMIKYIAKHLTPTTEGRRE